MNARPFSFGTDFRGSSTPSAVAQAEVEVREAQAWAAGHRAGLAEAESMQAGRLAAAADRIAAAMAEAIAGLDARLDALEGDSVRAALALARTLAGEALLAQPVAAVAGVAAAAFDHLRGVPHLVIRVREDVVEDVEAMATRMARQRGFEGRIVVLGEPDIAPGDARLEWADGGVVRDHRRLEAAIDRLAAEFGLTPRTEDLR